jgi:hypothetical protein
MKKFCKSWNLKKQLMLAIFNSKGIIFLAEMDMLFTLSTQIMKTEASKLSMSFKLSAYQRQLENLYVSCKPCPAKIK